MSELLKRLEQARKKEVQKETPARVERPKKAPAPQARVVTEAEIEAIVLRVIARQERDSGDDDVKQLAAKWKSIRPAIFRRWKHCAGYMIAIHEMDDLVSRVLDRFSGNLKSDVVT